MVKVSRILHAGYIFESGESRIIFDPIFENPFSHNCFAFPAVEFDVSAIRGERFDAVFISHFHDDHCSLESLNLIERSTPVYIYCRHREILDLIRELGFVSVFSLDLNTSVRVGEFEVIPRLALDPGVDSIFHIRSGGLNILNVVDAWIDPDAMIELRRHAPWDLVLWPFQTMREVAVLSPSRTSGEVAEVPHEWIEQLQELQPRNIVPSSCQFRNEDWSWYNRAMFPISYREFASVCARELPSSTLIRMNPGVSIELRKDSAVLLERLSWVNPVGNQDVDYEFDLSIPAPSTSSIATKFAGLSMDEKSVVDDFVHRELLRRYRELDVPEYFNQEVFWQLILFDQTGTEREFICRIKGCDITLVDSSIDQSKLGWRTEITEAKLYSALRKGEAMTSLYIRINDVKFSAETERKLEDVDAMIDPLVRCLFREDIGSYQRAQLAKLRG